MNMPAWLLLLWCGLGGTCGAAVIGSMLGGSTRAAWSIAPRPQSTADAITWSAVAGLIVYPAAYGLVFEALRRSDFRTGLAIGAGHALVMLLMHSRSIDIRAAVRIAAIHVVYATTLAFLYVTP